MKNQIAIFFVILAASFVVTPVAGHHMCLRKKMERTGSCNDSGYANAALINAPGVDSVLVGGQNGTWFVPGQSPKLYKVYLQNDSAVHVISCSE